MARRRYQHPKPEKVGNWWYVRVRSDTFKDGQRVRERQRIQLCSASKKLREVNKIADEYFQKLNKGILSVTGGLVLSDYIDRYYPATLKNFAAPVITSYGSMIEKYIRPAMGQMCFRELSPLQLQGFFSAMAEQGIEHPTRTKVRDALSSILRSAHRLEVIDSNPLEKVLMPTDKRGRQKKPNISPEQFNLVLAGIPEPYATMVYVAVWTGLRVSELCGLKWRCLGPDSISVEQRFCRGDWSRPKSEASAATIGVRPEVLQRIHQLKDMTVSYRAGRALRKVKAVRSSGPDDLVFQSVWKSRPMSDGNVLRRHIKPIARKLGLGYVNWRCLRTSHATWLVQAGADPKSVQGQMRHARVSTTMDIYAQVVPEAQKQALRKLAAFVPNHGPVMGQNIAPETVNLEKQSVSIQ